jgi:energy-converting hydrogenase Eha subunit A
MLETVGLSPKAIAAFFAPVVIAVGAAAASWIVTGNFDDTEVRTALGGAVAGVLSFVGAYLAQPGNVTRA